MKKKEEKENEVLKLKICPKCEEKNDPISRFCGRCATPLEVKVALDLEEEMKEKEELTARVIERLCEKLNLEKAIQETIKELKLEEKIKRI